MKLSSLQVARIAYAACNEAVAMFGDTPKPEWASLSGDQQTELLGYVNGLISGEKKLPIPLQFRPKDNSKYELCARIFQVMIDELL